MADVSFSTVLSRLEARVETVTGFKRSLRPLDPAMDPNSIGDKRYAIDLRTSNARIFRDKAGQTARVEHETHVRFLRRLPPKDQNTRLGDSMDDELDIIQALSAQTGSWQQDLSIIWAGSIREVLDPGEWLLTTITFSVSHDISLTV